MSEQTLKNRVLLCLADEKSAKQDKYNKAFLLYRESENKDANQERLYNLGFTDMNFKNLLYDLQKIYGVTDLEIAKAKMEVVKEVTDLEIAKAKMEVVKDVNDIEVVGEEVLGNTELTGNGTAVTEPEFVSDFEEALKDSAEDKKRAILRNDLKVLVSDFEQALKGSAEDKERAILRNDFPFLDDANCPDELKVLVADKITAFRKYTQAHAKLIKHSNGELELTPEELAEVTRDSVENFETNRAIFKELDYYKAQGKILGEHPIFKELTLQREVDAMNNEECVKYLNSSKKYISVKTKELENLIKEKSKGYKDKMISINADIATRQEKVALVKKKLNFNE